MRRLVSTLTLVVVLWLVGSAHAVTLVDQSGQPLADGPYGFLQQWANDAQVATIPGDLAIDVSTTDCRGALACSDGPFSVVMPDGSLLSYPTHTAVTYVTPWVDRESFYWELGHQFDWNLLSHQQRQAFQTLWRMTNVPWWDTYESVVKRNIEDGVEAEFALVYALCATGQSPDSVQLLDMPQQPWMAAPEVTCATIDYVGAVDHATAPYVPPGPVHAARNRRHHHRTLDIPGRSTTRARVTNPPRTSNP